MSGVLPPPPPPRGNSGGCWKVGAITCGGCGCLALIAMVILGIAAMKSPIFKKAMEMAQSTPRIQRNMLDIHAALVQYDKLNRRYPAKLEDLVKAKLIDASQIVPPGSEPGSAYIYHQPPKNAPSSFVILRYDMPNFVKAPNAPPVTFEMALNGDIWLTGGNVRNKLPPPPVHVPR